MRNCTKFYIDGQWVDPVEENTQPVENPATEETIGHISFGTKADVDKAVAAARRAFESFSQTSKEERLTLLRAIQADMHNARELLDGIRDHFGAFRSTDNIDFVYKDSASQPAPDDVISHVAENYKAAVLAIAD